MTYTILVADDESGISRLIEAVLTGYGVRVLSAAHGFEAWRMMRDERPDMALLDLRLPFIDALALTRAVRGNADLQAMRLILCTADRGSDSVTRATEAGIDGLLLKPFTVSDVLRLVPTKVERQVG